MRTCVSSPILLSLWLGRGTTSKSRSSVWSGQGPASSVPVESRIDDWQSEYLSLIELSRSRGLDFG